MREKEEGHVLVSDRMLHSNNFLKGSIFVQSLLAIASFARSFGH